MLQLIDITKSYTAAGFTQAALDELSVTFRDNEFAAVLGPSGSGKTTLLNIIGGLDHADSGRLVIDGISTENYKDRDWDTYRNNRIGFVFQSYNLIPHQTVLANVELALTLSGVSKTERQKRAKAVLAEVGLADHMNKKPSQLSGGQMQRVAIARAIVNDPEILLADEPTGALDSKTSLQIMDLLTQIAADRLVIMVTHNPNLAEQYANRIINLEDGHIVSDTNPLVPRVNSIGQRVKNIRRTSMSFFTSVALSFSNLMTKKGRTIITAFASSIGIIGIATILALANGVNSYIKSVEEDTLSAYPLTISKSGIDLSAILSGSSGNSSGSGGGLFGGSSNNNSSSNTSNNNGSSATDAGTGDGTLAETSSLSRMFNAVSSNDLKALKVFLDDDSQSQISSYVNAIEYHYDVTPQIYLADTSSAIWEVNPSLVNQLMGNASGLFGGSSSNSFSLTSMGSSLFSQLPADMDRVEPQYNLLAGHWPTAYDEAILITSSSGKISDYLAYTLGLRDPSMLQGMIQSFQNQQNVDTSSEGSAEYSYSDIMNADLRIVTASDCYSFDPTYGYWVDHSKDNDFMKNLISTSPRLKIVGIASPDASSDVAALSQGIAYTPQLTTYLMDQADQSQIVQDQLASPDIDVFSNKTFEELANEKTSNDFDMSKLITVNQDALSSAFQFDPSVLSNININGLIDPNSVMAAMPAMPTLDLTQVMSGLSLSDLPVDGLTSFATAVLQQYLTDRLPDAEAEVTKIVNGFGDYLQSAKVQKEISDALPGLIDQAGLGNLATSVVTDYINYCGQQGITDPTVMAAGFTTWLASPDVTANITTQLTKLVDTEALQTFGTKLVTDYLTQSKISIEGLTTSIGKDFTAWLQDPKNSKFVSDTFSKDVDLDPLIQKLSASLTKSLQASMTSYITQFMGVLTSQIQQGIKAATAQLSTQMASAMKIDVNTFKNAFQFNLDQNELTALLMQMVGGTTATYDSNLKSLGYATLDSPSSINIYPKDFASKQQVLDILDNYNQKMQDTDQADKVITYTDIVGVLMSSVTQIVSMITMVLIVFVSISLVVSSIMIGIVTFNSVLERKKEIGILRSIGASKRDIGNVFNAETLLVGFISGCIGILITVLLTIPANIIVFNIFGIPNIVSLPWIYAVILIAISCLLSFVAGLIPSAAASRRDPVEALRSE